MSIRNKIERASDAAKGNPPTQEADGCLLQPAVRLPPTSLPSAILRTARHLLLRSPSNQTDFQVGCLRAFRSGRCCDARRDAQPASALCPRGCLHSGKTSCGVHHPFLSGSLEPVAPRRRSERNDGLAMRRPTIDARGSPSRGRRNHATTPRRRTSLRRGPSTALAARSVSPPGFVTKTAAIYDGTSLTESRPIRRRTVQAVEIKDGSMTPARGKEM
jgi:hypothetical protein